MVLYFLPRERKISKFRQTSLIFPRKISFSERIKSLTTCITTYHRNKSNKELIPNSVLETATNTWLWFDSPEVYISSETPKNIYSLYLFSIHILICSVQHDELWASKWHLKTNSMDCRFICPRVKFHLY